MTKPARARHAGPVHPPRRRTSRRIPLALAVVLAALATAVPVASAHTPEEGTSRLSLRDGHVEVVAEWDLFLLLPRTPTEVATASEDELAKLHRELVATIERETRLTVDGAERRLEVRGFPTPPELRALAASLSAAAHEHGARARIRLEAHEPVNDAREMALTSPAKLGRVNTSFVQPRNHYAEPGVPVAFTVLHAASEMGEAAPSGGGRAPRSTATSPLVVNQTEAPDSGPAGPSGTSPEGTSTGHSADSTHSPPLAHALGFTVLGALLATLVLTLFGRRTATDGTLS